MKKRISILVVCIMLSLVHTAIYAADRSSNEVQLLVEAVCPGIKLDQADEKMTRAEFCKLVYNIRSNTEFESTAYIFPDVDTEAEYAGYIQAVYEEGLISGDESGMFRPDEEITACEAYTMLLKLAGYKKRQLSRNGHKCSVSVRLVREYQLEL